MGIPGTLLGVWAPARALLGTGYPGRPCIIPFGPIAPAVGLAAKGVAFLAGTELLYKFLSEMNSATFMLLSTN